MQCENSGSIYLSIYPGYLNHPLLPLPPQVHLRQPPSLLYQKLAEANSKSSESKMQYNAPTFHLPPTMPERQYPAGMVVETTLRVWAISRWRGARELAACFLHAGFAHLPPGSPIMFHLNEMPLRAPLHYVVQVLGTLKTDRISGRRQNFRGAGGYAINMLYYKRIKASTPSDPI